MIGFPSYSNNLGDSSFLPVSLIRAISALHKETMMRRFSTRSSLRLLLEVFLIFAILAAVLLFNLNTKAAPNQANEAPTASYWYQCNGPNHVAAFVERVHIFCTTTTPVLGAPILDAGILWFSVATAQDSAGASRFLSLFQTSVITGKPIWLLLDPNDTSGNSFGCGSANCRRIIAVEMR